MIVHVNELSQLMSSHVILTPLLCCRLEHQGHTLLQSSLRSRKKPIYLVETSYSATIAKHYQTWLNSMNAVWSLLKCSSLHTEKNIGADLATVICMDWHLLLRVEESLVRFDPWRERERAVLPLPLLPTSDRMLLTHSLTCARSNARLQKLQWYLERTTAGLKLQTHFQGGWVMQACGIKGYPRSWSWSS